MPYIKQHEEIIYQAVIAGELEIDVEGRIWRIAKRGWDNWNHCVRLNSCRRVRAEGFSGNYLTVKVMFNKKRYLTSAHRVIYRHFFGKLPKGMIINHKDGNKTNNHPSNLELVTPSGNMLHAVHILKKGRVLQQSGEKNLMAKLTWNQVREIRQRRLQGELLKSIAKDYDISYKTVSKIALRQRWKEDSGSS